MRDGIVVKQKERIFKYTDWCDYHNTYERQVGFVSLNCTYLSFHFFKQLA